MKNIVISGRRLAIERRILVVCFGLATLANVVAIVRYHTPWQELLTALPVILALTLGLYLLTVGPRLALAVLLRLWAKLEATVPSLPEAGETEPGPASEEPSPAGS